MILNSRQASHWVFISFRPEHLPKIVELGYKTKYNEDANFRQVIKCFPALAFLPVDQVTDGFEVLTEDWSIPQEFVSYFELTYILYRP